MSKTGADEKGVNLEKYPQRPVGNRHIRSLVRTDLPVVELSLRSPRLQSDLSCTRPHRNGNDSDHTTQKQPRLTSHFRLLFCSTCALFCGLFVFSCCATVSVLRTLAGDNDLCTITVVLSADVSCAGLIGGSEIEAHREAEDELDSGKRKRKKQKRRHVKSRLRNT